MTTLLTRTGDVSRLVALRRQDCDDSHVTGHDRVTDDGEKIYEQPVGGADGTASTSDISWSALFRSSISMTGDVSILRIEAELYTEDPDRDGNPHIPVDEATLETAVEKIESDGHTPAWVVLDE